MSWSINFIGKTENVVAALKGYSEKLTDQSKAEYDSALPHLVGLVEKNIEPAGNPIIHLSANGHGCFAEGKQVYGTLNVELKRPYGDLV